ncbi:purine-cytosine permease family protein [Pseudonocardia nigra]|uniref:purine-cytosine permease family protein n=1 Tax=Pseudonocardia nigra TaxID=1921578 RepID=UPI001C5F1049|nr:cytosine permease [Pseudonocardia nigra]
MADAPTGSTDGPSGTGTGTVEVRSIDWVPLGDRRGRPWSLGPLWFMANAQVTTLATGMLGAALGASFLSSLLAVVLGAALGTVFTAFHSAQGPQLGLPQMIQSRAQFGYRGVAVMCAFVVLSLTGFNVFNQALAAEALNATVVDNTELWYVVLSALALLLAVFGYHWIHATQRWLTLLFLATFGVFTVVAVVEGGLSGDQLSLAGFEWTSFLVQFGAAAAYQLGWAPYVSDYSRYLPPQTSPRAALWHTYGGSLAGAVWLMALGALLAAGVADAAPLEAIRTVADEAVDGFGTVILLAAIPGLVSVMTLNIYAASLNIITIADSVRPVRPTLRLRIVTCSAVTAAALLGAWLSTGAFLDNFGTFLVILLYVLIPWTSVNLVDYYFVRRGEYAIREIFRPDGRYGRWAWRGLVSYCAGIAAMVPFISSAWYTGPAAEAMGGADLALFVGVVVSGAVYLAVARSLDLEAERRLARDSHATYAEEAVTFRQARAAR